MSLVDEIDYSDRVSEISAVKFGLLSPQRIRAQSVANIYRPLSNPSEIAGTINDPRLGTSDRRQLNHVSKLSLKYDPGHFGHLELAKPVIVSSQNHKFIIKVLNSVCYRCSSLKLDTSDPVVLTSIRTKQGKNRFNHVTAKAATCKDSCSVCAAPAVTFTALRDENIVFGIVASIKSKKIAPRASTKKKADTPAEEAPDPEAKEREGEQEANEEADAKMLKTFNQEMCYLILSRISDQDVVYLGLDPTSSRPEWMLWTVMPIPPPAIRPSVETEDGLTSSDDLTNKLNEIVKTNYYLTQLLVAEKEEAVKIPINQTGKALQTCNFGNGASKTQEQWCLLQYHVATYIDNEISNVKKATNSRSSRPLKTLRQRIKSKKGRIRRNLMGKRVNYSARSVITPDPSISIDQVGVPLSVAMTLTWPETVTPYNIEFLTRVVRNGPFVYPGANYIKETVITSEGQVKLQMRQLKYLDYETKSLSVGMTVFRHLIDDDAIFFNRQPSLHKMSMMTHRAKILHIGNTFRLNPQVTTPYNADFDGDEMNAHVPRSLQTKAELIFLTSVPTQIVSPQANKPVMGLVQDSLLGSYRFTSSDARERYSSTEFYGTWRRLKIDELRKLLAELPTDNNIRQLIETQIAIPKIGEQAILEDWQKIVQIGDLIKKNWSNIPLKSKEVDDVKSPCAPAIEISKDTPLYKVKQKYLELRLDLPSTYLVSPARFNLLETMHLIQGTNLYTGELPDPDNRAEFEENSQVAPYWTAQTIASYCLPALTYKHGDIAMKMGQLTKESVFDKGTVGVASNSLIHVTWNDFGPETTRNLFDNLSSLAINWVLKGGFSIGFRDISIDTELAESNFQTVGTQIDKIQKDLVDKVHTGRYQLESRQTVREQFELDIKRELDNLRSQIEEVTYKSVPPWNRIHNTITSGSKGKKNNLVQIMAMLGQQDMEGARIPDYFYRRTLPHFYKDAIEPEAKGFVADSFLVGLSPTNFWAHAQSGRIGVISTSIKTAETGYIQRKLIKVMEDAMAATDGTIRNSLNLILQFFYGNDGFDASRLEPNPIRPVVVPPKELVPTNMVSYYFSGADLFFLRFGYTATDSPTQLRSLIYEPVYKSLDLDKVYKTVDREYRNLLESRRVLREEIYLEEVPDTMYLPLNFQRILINVMDRVPSILRAKSDSARKSVISDLDPIYVVTEVETLINSVVRESSHFEAVQQYATRELVCSIRANLASKVLLELGVSREQFDLTLELVYQKISEAYLAPGEMVGSIAAQSIGEPTTQLTLNTFHQTGIGSAANVSRGVPRMKEIMDITKNPKTPSYEIVLRDSQLYRARKVGSDTKTIDRTVRAKLPDGGDNPEYKKQIELVKLNVNETKNKLDYTTLRDLSTSVHVVAYNNTLDPKEFPADERHIIEIAKTSPDWAQLETGEASAPESEEGEEVEKTSDTVWIIHFNIDAKTLPDLDQFEGRLEVVYLAAKATEEALRLGGPGKKKWSGLELYYNYSGTGSNEHYFQILIKKLGDHTGGGAKRGSGGDDPVEKLRLLTKRFEAVHVRGIAGIEQAYCREIKKVHTSSNGARIPARIDEYNTWKTVGDYSLIIDTNNTAQSHSLYQLFNMDEVDFRKTYSNNIHEIMSVLGIEAARDVIIQEIVEVLEFAATYINHRHIEILADVMTVQGYLVPVSRYGVNKSDNGPWSRASFEETASQVSTAALFSEEDPMTGVTPNIMFGQFIKSGTNASQILIDEVVLDRIEPPVQSGLPVEEEDEPRVTVSKQGDAYCSSREKFMFMFVAL